MAKHHEFLFLTLSFLIKLTINQSNKVKNRFLTVLDLFGVNNICLKVIAKIQPLFYKVSTKLYSNQYFLVNSFFPYDLVRLSV